MKQTNWHPAVGEPLVSARLVVHSRLNGAQSRKQDKEVYEDALYCEQKAVASNDTFAERVVADNLEKLKTRFPGAFAELEGEEVDVVGTPIFELSGLTADRAMTLQLQGIRTIEQMAEIPDGFIMNMGFGAAELKKQAVKFLDTSSGSNGGQSDGPSDNLRDQIEGALQLLDPAKDAHWTQAGKPSMDALQDLLPDVDIKRSDVDAVAPEFERPEV